MKLVVDTNILFSYFWRYSITRRILLSQNMELVAPEFALEEINKYKKDIITKNNLTTEEFEHIKFDLAIAITFIPLEKYAASFKVALSVCPDPNDIDFFALAITLKLPIWSNDTKLKEQNKIKILTTTELLRRPKIKKIIGDTS
ncbi:MAG: PIN domain-containing protein [Candidatus Woesearchaeota archaeon]